MTLQQPRRHRATSSLRGDMDWCARQLQAGRDVFCIRRAASGLVVTYISGGVPIRLWHNFDGAPLADYTVTPLRWDGNRVAWGREVNWSRYKEEGA